jgi:hypothetical protein
MNGGWCCGPREFHRGAEPLDDAGAILRRHGRQLRVVLPRQQANRRWRSSGVASSMAVRACPSSARVNKATSVSVFADRIVARNARGESWLAARACPPCRPP